MNSDISQVWRIGANGRDFLGSELSRTADAYAQLPNVFGQSWAIDAVEAREIARKAADRTTCG